MKIQNKEISIFIGSLLALSIVILLLELTNVKDKGYDEIGSHGVYDHA